MCYLEEILKNLTLKMPNSYYRHFAYRNENNGARNISGGCIELSGDKYSTLEGWCWETTEAAILFFPNDAYIERSRLYLEKRYPNYEHAYICFLFCGVEYVFDPALNIFGQKDLYNQCFDSQVFGKVTAREVKKEFLEAYKQKLNNPFDETEPPEKAYFTIASLFDDHKPRPVEGERSSWFYGTNNNNSGLFRFTGKVLDILWTYPKGDANNPPKIKKMYIQIDNHNG